MAGKGWTVYLGVDPGSHGYVAVLLEYDTALFDPLPRLGGKQDLVGLVRLFGRWGEALRTGSLPATRMVAIVEDVHAMPKQGVSSTFSFGRGLGRIEAAIVAAGIPMVMVSPVKWKRDLLQPREREAGKDGSVLACERLLPSVTLPTAPKSGRIVHDACDALCLALYGRRHGL